MVQDAQKVDSSQGSVKEKMEGKLACIKPLTVYRILGEKEFPNSFSLLQIGRDHIFIVFIMFNFSLFERYHLTIAFTNAVMFITKVVANCVGSSFQEKKAIGDLLG